jgi:chromosome segregation ATPase
MGKFYIRAIKSLDPMKVLLRSFIVLLSLGLFACSSGDGEKGKDKSKDRSSKKMKEVKQLQKEVKKVHDEVMPKMGELQSLKDEAKSLSDSLRSAGDTNIAARLDKTAARLERGHEAMMTWMRQYEKPYRVEPDTLKAASPSAAIDYLEGQKKDVEAMRDTMMGALKHARTRLDSLEKAE